MNLEENGLAQSHQQQQQNLHNKQHIIINSKADADEQNIQMVQTAYNEMASSQTFNRIVKGIRVLTATGSTLLAELTVATEKVNDKGTMHGGCTAALVDILTATSVRLLVPDRPIVSIDLSVSYLAPAKLGESILLEATCLKAGFSVAFTEATFRKEDGTVLIRARQQLAILRPKRPPPVGLSNGVVKEKEKSSPVVETNLLSKKNHLYETGGSHLEKMRILFAGMQNKQNFYQIAKNLEVLYAEPPRLAVVVRVAEEHLNNGGTLHGGFTASIVDIVTSRAVSMTDICPRVSMDLSVSYLLPAKIGDEIVVEANCLKIGGMMAFTEATLTRRGDGAMVAKGKHNMFMLRHRQQPQQQSLKNSENSSELSAEEMVMD